MAATTAMYEYCDFPSYMVEKVMNNYLSRAEAEEKKAKGVALFIQWG